MDKKLNCSLAVLMTAANLLKYTSKNCSLSKALFEKARITRGVLQGSVLGPVLFFLLANHLPYVLHEHSAKPLCMLITRSLL